MPQEASNAATEPGFSPESLSTTSVKPNWEVLHLHLKTLTWRNNEKCQQGHLGMGQTKAKETGTTNFTHVLRHPSLRTMTRFLDPNPYTLISADRPAAGDL